MRTDAEQSREVGNGTVQLSDIVKGRGFRVRKGCGNPWVLHSGRETRMPSPLSTVGNNGSPRRKRIPSILPGQFSGFPYPGSTAPWTEPARRSLGDRLACHPELRLLRRGSMLAACTCGGKALDMVKEHPRGTGSVATSRHVSASPGDSGMPPQRPSLRRRCLTQAGPNAGDLRSVVSGNSGSLQARCIRRPFGHGSPDAERYRLRDSRIPGTQCDPPGCGTGRRG